MNCSQFVGHLNERGVRLLPRGDRFVARGASTLTPWLKQSLAAHREEIAAFVLRGEDVELKPSRARSELRALGFVLIPEIKQWVHPRGDEVGDRILLGLIDPDEVEPAELPVIVASDLREVYPGRYRWSETRDAITKDPFPRLPRVIE